MQQDSSHIFYIHGVCMLSISLAQSSGSGTVDDFTARAEPTPLLTLHPTRPMAFCSHGMSA